MGVDRIPIAERARGRWPGILAQLGVPATSLTGKHGPCPICRVGHDRFRFDNKDGRGTFICSKCGAGDGVKLVMEVNGWDFRQAAQEVERVAGDVSPERVKPDRPEHEKREALNRLWRSASPAAAADPVGLWLASRVGLVAYPADLRCGLHVRYEDDPPSHHPAMLALVRGTDGAPVNIHRTYLTKDGQKAPVEKPRRMMPGTVPKGAAVRLFPAAETMGIAEGIETAFAAASLFSMPVWAALGTAGLTSWLPPPQAREIIVFGDKDTKFGGQAAAYALAHRLATSSRGHAVEKVSVELPGREGADWNDVLKDRP